MTPRYLSLSITDPVTSQVCTGAATMTQCVYITAVPIVRLFAWGEGDSGGHVLRETDLEWPVMMMSFICSCRNKKEEQSSIYTLRKVRTIRGCLEGLTLMI